MSDKQLALAAMGFLTLITIVGIIAMVWGRCQ